MVRRLACSSFAVVTRMRPSRCHRVRVPACSRRPMLSGPVLEKVARICGSAERRLVRPEGFLQALSWGSAPSAAIILEEGLKVEAAHRKS